MAKGRFVAYYRVSTRRQGRSGLGLDAQRAAVTAYLNGGRWKLVADFTEQESGRMRERPQLVRALAACRAYGATLIVAKFDRLTRNPRVLYDLQDSRVEFVAVDLPGMTPMIAGVMAHAAEEVAKSIGEHTRAALAAARRRGVQLGTPENLTDRARAKGRRVAVATRQAHADERARDLAPIIADLRAEGAMSLRALAAGLTGRGIEAPRGGEWSAVQVARLLGRLPTATVYYACPSK